MDQGSIEIKLSQGKVSLIDSSDFDLVKNFKWHFSNGYARSRIEKKRIYMHNLIMGNVEGKEIDHVSRNTLDNRRINLRFCSRGQNNYNQLRVKNLTGFRGVYKKLHKTGISWVARATVGGKNIYLGAYKTASEAGKAFEDFAIKNYQGFYGRRN